MARLLSLDPRTSALAVGTAGLVATSVIAVNFAWRSIAEPLEPSAGSRITKSATATKKPVVQIVEEAPFQFENLIARPLFSPERRPPIPVEVRAPVATPVASPVVEVAPSYSVGGIIVSPDLNKALLRTQRREAGFWFALGERTEDGWAVSSIEPSRVVLTRGDRKMTLPLYAGDSVLPAAAVRR